MRRRPSPLQVFCPHVWCGAMYGQWCVTFEGLKVRPHSARVALARRSGR